VTTCQDEYLKQLNAIEDSRLQSQPLTIDLPLDLTGKYGSLLGGVAWVGMSRADALVYIQYLQRNMKKPAFKHLKDLNRLLRWLVRTKCTTKSIAYVGTPVIHGVADSAFKAEEDDCLALRGCVIGLGTADGTTSQVVDFWCRKHRRVTRSTFAAELINATEVAEFCMMLAGFYEEVLHGVETSQTLAQKLLEGRFKTRVQVYIDAYSVYSAVCTQQVRMPSETSLIYEIETLHDHLKVGRLARLYWIDTEDMVTDGLTKGSVNRSAILHLLATGTWTLKKKYVFWPQPVAATDIA
jgi:hypothetical protein